MNGLFFQESSVPFAVVMSAVGMWFNLETSQLEPR